MRSFFVGLGALWFAATLQFGLPARIEIFGARPDFLALTAFVLSLLVSRAGGALAGFAAGAWQGVLAGANLAHYVISRAIIGFLLSWTRRMSLEISAPVAGVVVAIATLLSGVIFMFTAAPRSLAEFLVDTIGTAVYNGVLAMPLYVCLRWLIGTPRRHG